MQIEIPIHASNVMHVDAKGEPTRKAPVRTEGPTEAREEARRKGKGREAMAKVETRRA